MVLTEKEKGTKIMNMVYDIIILMNARDNINELRKKIRDEVAELEREGVNTEEIIGGVDLG